VTALATDITAAAGFRRRSWSWLTPWALLAPGLLLIVAIIIVPLIAGVTYAFRDLSMDNPFAEGDFIGLANFAHVFSDARLPRVIGNTVRWTLTTLVLQVVLGLSLALLLNGGGVWPRRLQPLLFVPWAVPSILVGLFFKLLVNPTTSFLPGWLVAVHLIGNPSDLLADPDTAMWGPIAAYVWVGIPFFAITSLAALKSIPRDLYDAMATDGASAYDQFQSITLPLIAPTLLIAVLLRSAWIANVGDFVWVMTQGGPAGSTQILPTFVFAAAFVDLDQGYAAALAALQAVSLFAYAAFVLGLRRRLQGG
jgi:multiple sugar transport system permease protein